MVVIRGVCATDLAAVSEVLEDGLLDPTTGAPLVREIDEHLRFVSETLRSETTRRYFVAALPDGRVVGIAGLDGAHITAELFTPEERPVEVVLAYVRRSHRGVGIGRSLIQHVETIATEMGFTTVLVVSGSRNRESGYPFWRRRYGEPFRWDDDYFGAGHERVVWRWSLAARRSPEDHG